MKTQRIVCVSNENDPSTRERYDYNIIVLKSFHFGDRFPKLSFSVKKVVVLDRFLVDAR